MNGQRRTLLLYITTISCVDRIDAITAYNPLKFVLEKGWSICAQYAKKHSNYLKQPWSVFYHCFQSH